MMSDDVRLKGAIVDCGRDALKAHMWDAYRAMSLNPDALFAEPRAPWATEDDPYAPPMPRWVVWVFRLLHPVADGLDAVRRGIRYWRVWWRRSRTCGEWWR